MTEPAAQESGTAVPPPEYAIMDMSQNGIVTSWNPAAAPLYGYLEEEIVGRGADVLVPEDRRPEEAQVMSRAVTDGMGEHYEAERVRKDGTVITVLVTAAPIIGAAGAIVGVNAVSWKVSAGEAAQDQLGETIDSERRDARDAQDQAEAAQDSQRRDAEDLFDARREDERREASPRYEGQLQHIQRMESLGQLAGGVAHDCRRAHRASPLAA